MNVFRFLALLPIAYIVFWFYALIVWIIPMLSIPFSNLGAFGSWTILSVIGVILFFTGGIFLLIICFILTVIILGAD